MRRPRSFAALRMTAAALRVTVAALLVAVVAHPQPARNADLERIRGEITKLRRKLNDVRAQTKTAERELEEVGIELDIRTRELQIAVDLQGQIEQEQQAVAAQVADVAQRMARQKEFLRHRLAALYRLGGLSYIRLLMSIDHITGWLYRVTRNRITDLFRARRPETLDVSDLLPSPDAGPEAEYVRVLLLEALERAIGELPPEQRDVFVANELEGRSFKELAAETGVGINTLLSRKRYAVLRLRERLRRTYEDLTKP